MTLFGANPVDVVVLLVLVVSALLALLRGFVAEILSIVGWVLAVFAVMYGLQPLQPHLEAYMGKGLLSMASSAGVLFVGTLALMSSVSYVISRQMRGHHLSAIDRSLGFLFGLLRGALLVCLLYICVSFVFPPKKEGEVDPNSMQATLKSARTQPALEAGSQLIIALAPNKSLSIDDLTKASPLEALMQPKPPAEGESKPDTGERGYTGPAREDLGRMIDLMGSNRNNDPAAPANSGGANSAGDNPHR